MYVFLLPLCHRASSDLSFHSGHHRQEEDCRDSRRRASRSGGQDARLPQDALASSRSSRHHRQGTSFSPRFPSLSFAYALSLSEQGVIGLQRAVIQQDADGLKDLLVEGQGLREVMTTDGSFLPFSFSPFSRSSSLLTQVSSAT